MAIFNSLLKARLACDSGHLINELGYRYNATFNVESCGTINLVNTLAAIKKARLSTIAPSRSTK